MTPCSSPLRALSSGALLAAAILSHAQTAPAPKPEQEGAVTLSPFAVTSTKDSGYGAASSGSSGRLNQRYIDMPQVTSVVTSELIADAALFSTIDVLKFVNNVQSRTPAHQPEYIIRGLYSPRNYFDGFYGGTKINFDTFFADRVEVVKGPSSGSFGRGDPAGMVNFISKQPFFRDSTEVGAMVGTGNSDQHNYRATVDHNAVAGGNGNVAYRLIGLHHTGAATRSLSEFDKNAAMLSMTRRFDARGSLTGSLFWSKENTPASVGNPGFIDPHQLREFLRRANNTTPNVPLTDKDYTFGYNSDGFAQDMLTATVILDYQLADKLRTRQAFRYTDVDKLGTFGAGNPGSIQLTNGVYTVSIPLLRDQLQTRGWSYQADFLTDWKMGDASKFTLLFGGDYSDLRDVDARQTLGTPRQPLLAFNRTDPAVTFPPITNAGIVNDGNNWGFYSQLQANLFSNKAELTLAGRKQFFDYTSLNRVTQVRTPIDDSTDIVPRVALSLRPTTWLSVYGLWTKHSDPGSTVAAFANIPAGDPRLGQSLTVQPETVLKELGVRAALLEDKLTVSAAVFAVKRTGAFSFIVFNEVINGTSFPVETRYLSGEDLTGWEVEAFGTLFGKLTFMANAGGVSGDSRIGPAANALIDPPEIADNASGYLRYRFSDSGSDGWSVIAGTKVLFSGWNMGNNITNPYPENQWQFDLGADYVWNKGRYKLSLKVNNVLDERITVGQNMRFDSRIAYLNFLARF